MRLFTLIISILLTSCMGITMPASIKTETSQFDGSTAYRMAPGFAFKEGSEHDFQIGAHWHNKTPEIVMLRGMIRGQFTNIVSAEGLQFNIDGEIVKLSSPIVITTHESSYANGVTYRNSYKDFTATRTLLSRIADAKNVKAKLVTASGYLEANLSIDSTGSAMIGLRNLNQKIIAYRQQ